MTLYLPLVTVPATLPFALLGWVWPTAREWAVLVAMSVATQLAQVQLTRGLQRERAARATAVGYCAQCWDKARHGLQATRAELIALVKASIRG